MFLLTAAALTASTAALAQTALPAPVAPPQVPVPTIHPVPTKTFTRAESVALVREHFGRFDANKDGVITTAEIDESHARFADKVRHSEGGRPNARRMLGGRGFGGRMIVRADSNKDGRITLAEAEALAMQHFDRLDTNRDGQVTPEERRAGRPMIKKSVEEKKTSG